MNGKRKINFTIFGGTGDLTFRKLIPALYHLYLRYRLDKEAKIVVVGRKNYTKETYCAEAKKWIKKNSRFQFEEGLYHAFCECIQYYQMDFTKEEEFKAFCDMMNKQDIETHLIYYAVAPQFFEVISDGLAGLRQQGEIKIVLEKPFGSTLENARKLNEQLEKRFRSNQIYRIDHYLGKEMIQNIQTIRFANPLFKDGWNRNYIEKVEIIASEELGVESRGAYYDHSGALQDMVQNHLFQILSIVAMEKAKDEEDVASEQLKLLNSIRKISQDEIEKTMILGQYDGYLTEANIAANSTTETFAKLCLYIDNERWQDVPFFVVTGKKMKERTMEVVLTFKNDKKEWANNVLRIKIQPQEGIQFRFNIKRPGNTEEVIFTEMDFCKTCVDHYRLNTPEAYEWLIEACIQSKTALFSKWSQIEKSWEIINHLKSLYREKKLPVVVYQQGSESPMDLKR
ncbi:MAG: glucose-6-phosphate dehydrogenase [Anaerorhabdus sp.]